ncbi:hypothetical protein WME77_19175 [Sorangium sp. So ce764]|uniref:hypothetical protein n=1 Tax=Sorangium sp. So ce764 TaxID=3133320 RepID=UPI003F5E3EE3
MKRPVAHVDELQDYIRGVLGRADHHANNVNEIVLAIAGAIVWRKDDDAPVRVLEKGGQLKNALWVRIGGKEYALSYNHTTATIDLKAGGLQGDVVHSFSNATPVSEVKAVFERL